MAGRYSKQELKDKLQRSALQLVATEGIERLSTRRLSAGCGLSDPYIYQCYSDIPELLADTFLRVDCEVAELMRTVIGTQFIAPAKPVKLADVCRLLWDAYWRYLMEDPERTVFYWRYYHSGYYNRDILAVREKNYRVLTDFIVNTGKTLGLSDDAQRLAGGYMTVYLALTVTVIMALCLALIEGCRYRGISLETECVMDIGMDSILAEYHRELQKQYNLFAIDCSYGTESASTKLTESHLLDFRSRIGKISVCRELIA